MIKRLPALPFAVSLLLVSPAAFATVRPHRHNSSHAMVRRTASTHSAHVGHISEHSSYSGISSERATEIQSALIQRGYLTGEPTGSWDSASMSAMQKLQSDNGWQTKLVPDSRALIKLGLGPGATPAASAASTAPTTSASVQAPATGQTF